MTKSRRRRRAATAILKGSIVKESENGQQEATEEGASLITTNPEAENFNSKAECVSFVDTEKEKGGDLNLNNRSSSFSEKIFQ